MRVNKGSLAEALLTALENSVDASIRITDFAYHHYRYIHDTPNLPKSSLSKAIHRLKAKGLIKKSHIDDHVVIELTNLGKNFLAINNSAEEWDGKWRIVAFDIPEQKRIVRNLFRRNLKKWGFRPLQKSVWVSKRDVYQKLIDYIKNLELEEFITVIEAEKIGPKKDI